MCWQSNPLALQMNNNAVDWCVVFCKTRAKYIFTYMWNPRGTDGHDYYHTNMCIWIYYGYFRTSVRLSSIRFRYSAEFIIIDCCARVSARPENKNKSAKSATRAIIIIMHQFPFSHDVRRISSKPQSAIVMKLNRMFSPTIIVRNEIVPLFSHAILKLPNCVLTDNNKWIQLQLMESNLCIVYVVVAVAKNGKTHT